MGTLDPFATLGVEARFDLDHAALEQRYRDLQRALHPDRHVDKAPAERRASLERAVAVNEAYRLLRNDLSRAEALIRLAGIDTRHEGTRGDPAFLMEVMELRESLTDARSRGDAAAVERLRVQVSGLREQTLARLREGFSQDRAATLLPVLERLRYLQRFLDEVDATEEVA